MTRAALLLAMCASCVSVRTCRERTLFVEVTLDDEAAKADSFSASLLIDGQTLTGSGTHKVGAASGTLEFTFASYPAGKTGTLTLNAVLAGETVASGVSDPITFAATCTRTKVSLSAQTPAPDLAPDLTEESDSAKAPLANGQGCSSADECDSHFCVDAVCCDRACDGQCESCGTGTCALLSDGQPVGGRTPCNGSGTCGGRCNGTSASCAYPAATVMCGAACDGTCDGAGTCSSGGTASCPNGFACGAGGCLTSCSSRSDCQNNFECNAPNCERVPESDCLDGLDNNGDGLADCEDPTCNALVTCAPMPSPGLELGALVASTDGCPGNYGSARLLHRNIVVPAACGNCGCQPVLTCSQQVSIAGASCGSPVSLGTAQESTNDSTFAQTNQCVSFAAKTGSNLSMGTRTTVGGSCTAIGNTTVPAISWGADSRFCTVARSSNTCGGGASCVARATGNQAICVRVPGGGSCPMGYDAAPVDWFESSTDNRACAACVCTPGGSPDCTFPGGTIVTYSDASCMTSVDNTGTTGCQTRLNGSTSIQSFKFYSGGNGTYGTCTRDPGTGSASATQKSTVCCAGCGCSSPPCISKACQAGQFCDGSACKTCNTIDFCGSNCTKCNLSDTCLGGTSCRCGASSPCDSRYNDNCTAGVCHCGAGASCNSLTADGCTAGVCTCNGGPACTGSLHCLGSLGCK